MTATWTPVVQSGGTYYRCHVEGFGYVAFGTSRSKSKALAYALEDLARQVVEDSKDRTTEEVPNGGINP